MKKTKLFGWVLMALASFSACTNDAEEVLAQESEIKLTSEITPSRVTNQELQSTQIVPGQKVGVTITGAKSEHKNVAWTAGENGVLTNTGDAVYYGNDQATITAYHPFNANWTSESHTFTVATDQSTNNGYLNSDLLWATATSTKTAASIALTFTHKLAKINVTLKSDDITDLSNATINICNTNISTLFDNLTGELSTASSNVQEIKAGVTTTTAYTASAIIIPQELESGTKFIKVTHNNKNFYYTLSAKKEFKSGYSYSYTLNVKENKVEIDVESDNITDWTDEEATGDAEEVDFSWFNPNQYLLFKNNYEMIQTNDDASKPDLEINRSYIWCPSINLSKIEIKFQMPNGNPTTYWPYEVMSNKITFYDNQLSVYGNTYLLDDLNVSLSDLMILEISYKDKYIKLNGVDLEHNIESEVNSFYIGGYIFSGGYYSDYDDGWLREWKFGAPDNSKLYYIKAWDENDELVYLGAVSIALNPETNAEEYCWQGYYKDNKHVAQFAYNSETLTNYQPYGGGVDQHR